MIGVTPTKWRNCPPRIIILIEHDGDPRKSHWQFGPGTINSWPNGDYYENGRYEEPAFGTYNHLVMHNNEYRELDPDFNLDIGL